MSAGYGPVEVLRDVSLYLNAEEIVTIIGPNGAGKSTFLKAVYGMADVHDGSIEMNGVGIDKLDTRATLHQGLALVLQGRCNFPELTVAENLEMGGFTVPSREVESRRSAVVDLLPLLGERAKAKAGQLSGGQQQLLEIGMMLMVEPRVLMLDEPTLGLDPKNVDLVLSHVRGLAESGLGILMVEQNARQALNVSDRGYVLADGRNQVEAPAASLLDNPTVATLYLGT